MKKLISLTFLYLFVFCTQKNEHQLPRIIVPEQKNVVEVDSKEMLHIVEEKQIVREFNKDTIIGLKKKFKNNDFVIFSDTITLPKYKLKITIDTSYTIASNDFEYKYIDFPENCLIDRKIIRSKSSGTNNQKNAIQEFQTYLGKTIKLRKDYVKCYPLLIYNETRNIAFLKINQIIQEAKDIDGKWKPIEFYDGLHKGLQINYKLRSYDYYGLAIIKYYGNFKTKIRTKIQINNHYYYSNEIYGYINKSQFNLDYLKKYEKFYYSYFSEKDLLEKEKTDILQTDL